MSQATFGRRGQVPPSARQAFANSAPTYDAAPAHVGKPPQWTQVTAKQNGMLMLICAGFLAAMMVLQAPGLLRDLRHSATYRPDLLLRTVSGDCTGWLFVLKTCKAQFRDLAGGEHGVRFMLMFASTDKQRILPMRAANDRDAVSVGFAVEKIGNRLMTFGGLALLLLAGLAIGALRLMQGRYKGGPAAAPWEAQPRGDAG